jgi:thiamine biosynthesis lipoprotein
MAGPAAERRVEIKPTKDGWAGRFKAMGSPCEVLFDSAGRKLASSVSAAVAAEAWRIEDKFSRYIDSNIIHRINTASGGVIEVDEETAKLLDFATTLHELSDSRFDITSGVLREVWKFDGSDRVPDAAAVEAVLGRVGWQRVSWRRPQLTLERGMEIDLGGIGKEYAVDRCAGIIGDSGCGAGLVNFGGDLAVTGPPEQRRVWKVGVEGVTPDAADKLIDLRAGALATSGDARRFLLRDGVRYGHILEPTTGWPVQGAPGSVTVAADSCTQAGMLSTLAMLQGDKAESFLEEQGVKYWVRR